MNKNKFVRRARREALLASGKCVRDCGRDRDRPFEHCTECRTGKEAAKMAFVLGVKYSNPDLGDKNLRKQRAVNLRHQRAGSRYGVEPKIKVE